MKLEAGKTYLTRNGDTVTVQPSHVLGYPWVSTNKADGKTWTDNGRYLNDGDDSDHDIVSEVSATPEAPTRTPHVHANEMHAFADGYEIEFFSTLDARAWLATHDPSWCPDTKYRVKPPPPAPVPNVVVWCAVLINSRLCYGDTDRSNAQRPGQTALLRIEIDHTDPASPKLVSATLEKP